MLRSKSKSRSGSFIREFISFGNEQEIAAGLLKMLQRYRLALLDRGEKTHESLQELGERLRQLTPGQVK